MVSRLSELALGEEGVVRVIQLSGSIKRRLLDLGCSSGCRILAVYRSIGGDSTAYLIKGSLFALRKEVSDFILIERVNGNELE